MSETKAPAAPKKAGGFFKILLIVLLAVAGGGAGAYFYFVKAAPAQAKEAEPEPPPADRHRRARAVRREPGRRGRHPVPARQPVARRPGRGAGEGARGGRRREGAHPLRDSRAARRSSRPTKLVTPEGKDELKKAIAGAHRARRPRTQGGRCPLLRIRRPVLTRRAGGPRAAARRDLQRRRRARHGVDVGARLPAAAAAHRHPAEPVGRRRHAGRRQRRRRRATAKSSSSTTAPRSASPTSCRRRAARSANERARPPELSRGPRRARRWSARWRGWSRRGAFGALRRRRPRDRGRDRGAARRAPLARHRRRRRPPAAARPDAGPDFDGRRARARQPCRSSSSWSNARS